MSDGARTLTVLVLSLAGMSLLVSQMSPPDVRLQTLEPPATIPPPLLITPYPESQPAELYDAWQNWFNLNLGWGWMIGDLDFNNKIDAVDLQLFRFCMSRPGEPYQTRYGTPPVLEVHCGLCDFDGDRDVDGMDLAYLQRQMGRTNPETRPADAVSRRTR